MNAPATLPTTTSQPTKPRAELAQVLQNEKSKWAASLPSHIKPEMFERVVLTAVQMNPALQSADRRTLLIACQKAAADGLMPDGREGALVIYKTKAKGVDGRDVWFDAVQWMPMVFGVIKKLRNSGEIASISSRVVYKNEVDQGRFQFYIQDGVETFRHDPILLGDRGDMALVYATARFKDGSVQTEILAKADVDKMRASSKAGGNENGPWAKWYEEMARKSAVRRLSKYLPLSAEDHRVLGRDDEPVTEFERQKAAALSLAASQMGAQPAAIAAPTNEMDVTPSGEIITEHGEIVEVESAGDTGVEIAADRIETVSDARVALQTGLEKLSKATTLKAAEDLNDEMKRALAGTQEIGVWNAAYLEAVNLMKKGGHKK